MGGWRQQRQEIGALVVAIGLHAAVLLVMRSKLETSDASSTTGTTLSASSWDIELAEQPEASAAVEAFGDGVPEIPSAVRDAIAHVVRPGNAHSAAPASIEPETPDPVAEARDEESESNASQDTAPKEPINLGIGPDGWQHWVTRPKEGEAPRTERAAPRTNRFLVLRGQAKSTTGGLQEGLEERDRALGLGPQGRVLSVLQEAAHAGVAPDEGVARFEVTVHRSGIVEVTLGGASRPDERWHKVAAFVARKLRAAPPRIPPPRDGVKLVVELAAEWTLPGGTKASELDEKSHLDVPPPKLQTTEEAKQQLERENPAIKNPTEDDLAVKLDAPGVYLADRGTWGSYRLGVGSIAPGYRNGAAVGPTFQGTFDPSNIGAKPQRMVRTRVIEQTLF